MSERLNRTIAVTNQKGGVGKTTTVINLGASLADMGYNILLIDLDPQGNASTGLGIGKEQRETSAYDVILGAAPIAEAIRKTSTERLDIVPAVTDLSSADIELSASADRTIRLRNALAAPAAAAYDMILIDCPPSLNLLTVNALAAADGVLIPLQCEFFALEGISQLLQTVGQVRTALNPHLTTQGIVLTMYDQRNNLTVDVENDVRETLGPLVLKTVIPRNVRLSEAPSHGVPVRQYDDRSTGSRAYEALAQEVSARIFGPRG